MPATTGCEASRGSVGPTSRRGTKRSTGRQSPIAADKSADPNGYRDRLYSAYASTHFAHLREPSRASIEQLKPLFRSVLRAHLPPDREARILDLGCGFGALVDFLHGEGYRGASGVDLSGEQVALARKLGIAGVEQADAIAHVGAYADTFDLITCFDLLEHLNKREVLDLLEAVRRALRVGGRLVIQTPNAGGPFGGRHAWGDFSHETAFTQHSIAQAFRSAGFADVSVSEVRPPVHGAPSALGRLLWSMLRLGLVLYLAAETGVFRGHVLSLNLVAVAQKRS